MRLTIGTDFGKHIKGHSRDISIANAYNTVLNYLSYLMCVSIKCNHFILETITNVKFNFDSLSILMI